MIFSYETVVKEKITKMIVGGLRLLLGMMHNAHDVLGIIDSPMPLELESDDDPGTTYILSIIQSQYGTSRVYIPGMCNAVLALLGSWKDVSIQRPVLDSDLDYKCKRRQRMVME